MIRIFIFRPIVLIPNRRVCLMLPALLLTLLTTATADPDANPIAKPKPRPRKLHNDFFSEFWDRFKVQVNLCQKQFLQQLIHNMHWIRNSMNNLLSYFVLVNARINASEKDLPAHSSYLYLRIKKRERKKLTASAVNFFCNLHTYYNYSPFIFKALYWTILACHNFGVLLKVS